METVKKESKDEDPGLFEVLAGIYFIASIVFAFMGMLDADYSRSSCNTANGKRITYLVPTYYLGCWLGTRPGEKE